MIQMNRKLKLLNFFYKRNNKNRKKSSGKKRRIFASAVSAANLFFGLLLKQIVLKVTQLHQAVKK